MKNKIHPKFIHKWKSENDNKEAIGLQKTGTFQYLPVSTYCKK